MSQNITPDIKLFVKYYITQQKNVAPIIGQSEDSQTNQNLPELQNKALEVFFQTNPQSQAINTFVEFIDAKRSNKWPQLKKAIAACKEQSATLAIAEIGSLTNNESFTKILLESKVNFHCCDQQFINRDILEALQKHAKIQKTLHGERIKKGLKASPAKSGNPEAAKVISEVNKPKIDAAIVFAFLLQPIIADYKRKNFSQRQMVKMLNEEGFTAPEGGKWVLSQLQKVLERVKVNEIVISLRQQLESYKSKELSNSQIADELNKQEIPALKKSAWNESQVDKVMARLQQIADIEALNNFVMDIVPVVRELKNKNYPIQKILQKFESNKVAIQKTNSEQAA